MTSLADVIIPPEDDSSANKTVEISDGTAGGKDQSQTTAPDWVPPEKFKGKTLRDVVEAYQNLESQAGRMASDLGEQRKLTDRILDLDRKRSDDLRKNGAASLPPLTTDELLTKPQESLERVVDARASHALDPINQRIAALEAALTEATFRNRHADADSIVNTPEFLEWVKVSPLRLRAAQAANAGNWTAANELLAEYKAQHGSTRSTHEATDDLASAKRVALETSGNVGGRNGDDGKPKGKLYSRAALMRLRVQDPDAYYDEAFQAEVLKAHAEGRVR